MTVASHEFSESVFAAQSTFRAIMDATARPGSLQPIVGIDGARFKRVVEPGDQLILEASIERVKGGVYKYKTRASVDGETAVEAELMCTMRKVV